jgi:hypothetical protein
MPIFLKVFTFLALLTQNVFDTISFGFSIPCKISWVTFPPSPFYVFFFTDTSSVKNKHNSGGEEQ